MPRTLIISAGPVNSPGIGPATGDLGHVDWSDLTGDPKGLPRPDIITISSNSGSSYFSGLAAGWTDANGHILPNLLKQYGRNANDYSKIAATGFSAGHGLFGPLLDRDGDSIDAAVLFDSCFTGKGPQSHPSNGKDGYASFGARAIRGEKLLVLTSSHGVNGPDLVATATGSECALESFRRAMATAGGNDEPFAVPAGIPTNRPQGNFYGPKGITSEVETHRDGNFFVMDYADAYYHGEHINFLSTSIVQAFMVPYLSTGEIPGLVGGGTLETFSKIPIWQILLGVAAAGVVIYGGMQLAKRRKANPILGPAPSPMPYKHDNQVMRLAMYEPSASAHQSGQIYFAEIEKKIRYGKNGRLLKTPKIEKIPGAGDNVVAFLDYHVLPGTRHLGPKGRASNGSDAIYIDYMATRNDFYGRGYAKALVQKLYADHADAAWIDWGSILHDAAAKLFFRQRREGQLTTIGKL